MKVSTSLVFLWLALFLAYSGCSKEEEPVPAVKNAKVVKPIKRPISKGPERAGVTEAAEPGSEGTTLEEIAKAAVREEPREAPEAAAVTEKPRKEMETAALAEKKVEPTEPGYYVVRRGDTLSDIAAREGVYGDPLKWPILYRLNPGKFGGMTIGADLPYRELNEGTRLRIITPEEAKENLKNKALGSWVINVISDTTYEEIVPAAIALMEKEYLVYITSVHVKGKKWMRVRVGFFETRAIAEAESALIEAMLKITGSWTARSKEELATFGGY